MRKAITKVPLGFKTLVEEMTSPELEFFANLYLKQSWKNRETARKIAARCALSRITEVFFLKPEI